MIEANAWFFDRAVPYRTMVRLLFEEGGRLRIVGEGVALHYPLSKVLFTRGSDGRTRIIQLPDGSHCESLDIEQLEMALKLHGLEEQIFKTVSGFRKQARRIGLGAAAVLFVLAGSAYLLLPPWGARTLQALPPTVVQTLSQRTLGLLATQLDVSTVAPQRQELITAQWRLGTQDLPGPFPLLFRAAPKLGPFMIALPNGTLVITDALLRVVSDEECLALLLHELGHVEGGHALAVLGRRHPLLALNDPPDRPQATNQWASLLLNFLERGPYPAAMEQQASAFAAPRQTALGLPPSAWRDAIAAVKEAAQRGNSPLFYTDLHPEKSEP